MTVTSGETGIAVDGSVAVVSVDTGVTIDGSVAVVSVDTGIAVDGSSVTSVAIKPVSIIGSLTKVGSTGITGSVDKFISGD